MVFTLLSRTCCDLPEDLLWKFTRELIGMGIEFREDPSLNHWSFQFVYPMLNGNYGSDMSRSPLSVLYEHMFLEPTYRFQHLPLDNFGRHQQKVLEFISCAAKDGLELSYTNIDFQYGTLVVKTALWHGFKIALIAQRQSEDLAIGKHIKVKLRHTDKKQHWSVVRSPWPYYSNRKF